MRLPFPERVLQQHIATLGKTGAGKSSAMRVIAEHQLDKKRRVAIVDPKGDWWGLKSSADGKGPGYPVIMFGDFKEPRATDVPIKPESGPHVAELIASGNRPCVIGFRGWMPNDMMQFWIGKDSNQAGFAQSLFNANEGELYVVIDEVHNFAPKGKTLDVQSGRSVHWTNRIMSEGRGLGLTFFIASQRPQKVHNDTLDGCETLIAMRVTHPRSREAAEEWLNAKADPKLAKEVLGTLAELQKGEAWVWSPENKVGPVRVQFPMFQTFDSFAPPQLQKKVNQSGWSEVDLDQVKEKLSAVIAEAKANDPKELKAEVARLRQELSRKQIAVPPPVQVADPRATERAVRQATAPLLTQIEKLKSSAQKTIDKACTELLVFRDGLASLKIPAIELPVATLTTPRPVTAVVSRPSHSLPAPAAHSSNGSLQKGEKEILLAAAQCHPASRTQLTILTGYKKSTRNRYIQYLQQKELVEDRDDRIIPTAAGMAALGDSYEPLPTGSELQTHWLARLPEGEKLILKFVLGAGGAGVDREAISEATGYQKSTRNRYIQYLQARQLLKEGTGAVVPAEMLFDSAVQKYA